MLQAREDLVVAIYSLSSSKKPRGVPAPATPVFQRIPKPQWLDPTELSNTQRHFPRRRRVSPRSWLNSSLDNDVLPALIPPAASIACRIWRLFCSGKESVTFIGSGRHSRMRCGSLSVRCCPHPSTNKRLCPRQLTNTDLHHCCSTHILQQAL